MLGMNSGDSPELTDGKIQRVWIEEGCISCSLCEDYCPEVFAVIDGEVCVVKTDAAEHFLAKAEEIQDAAEDCPVEVIRWAADDEG